MKTFRQILGLGAESIQQEHAADFRSDEFSVSDGLSMVHLVCLQGKFLLIAVSLFFQQCTKAASFPLSLLCIGELNCQTHRNVHVGPPIPQTRPKTCEIGQMALILLGLQGHGLIHEPAPKCGIKDEKYATNMPKNAARLVSWIPQK